MSFNTNEGNSEIENNENVTKAAYAVNRRNVPVTMEAKLDASVSRRVDQTANEHQRLFDWARLSEIKAKRKLQCTVTSLQPGLNRN